MLTGKCDLSMRHAELGSDVGARLNLTYVNGNPVNNKVMPMNKELPKGVMLNAYPDSIGETLADMVTMLKRP